MKRYVRIILITLLTTVIIVSFKKDNAKDYAVSIENKTCWGKFAYSGESSQYYCIHFNANGSFTWSEMAGDYTGHWVLDGKHLTITFSVGGKQIKADISRDGKLFNIENNSSCGYTIDSGDLITTPNTASPANTLWKGSYSTGPGTGMTAAVNFRFLTGLKFQMEFVADTTGPYSYNRSASGLVIRGPYNFFGIVVSGTEIKGTDGGNLNDWQVTRVNGESKCKAKSL